MAGNLKAGIMATTTMVGSAWAYSKANTADGQSSEATMSGMRGQQSQTGGQVGVGTGGCHQQHQQQHNKYNDTVQQMMHWKY